MLLHLGSLLQPVGPGRHHEGGVSTGAELAVHACDHHVDVRDAAVRGPGLLAVQDPFVRCLVVARARPDRGHVRAGVGLRGAEGGDGGLGLRAEALRDPFDELVRRPRRVDRRHREGGPHDRHPDSGIAPEELLVDDRHRQPGGIHPELRDALEPVEADLGGLLDHRPRGFLALVPLVGGGAHHLLGEAVHPVADVLLVLAQLQVEARLLLGSGAVHGGRGLLGGRLRARRFHHAEYLHESMSHVSVSPKINSAGSLASGSVPGGLGPVAWRQDVVAAVH